MVRPKGRNLRCNIERTVKKYDQVLKQLLVRHQAFEKLEHLQQNYGDMTCAKFQLMFNT